MSGWFVYMVSFVVSLVSVWKGRTYWKGGNKPGSVATYILSISIVLLIVLLILDVKIVDLF